MATKEIFKLSEFNVDHVVNRITCDICNDLEHVEPNKLDAILQLLNTLQEDNASCEEKFLSTEFGLLQTDTLQRLCNLVTSLMTLEQDYNIIHKCIEILKYLCLQINITDVQIILHHCTKLLDNAVSSPELFQNTRLTKVVHLICDIVSSNHGSCNLETCKCLEDIFFKSLTSDVESVAGVMLSLILPVIIASNDQVNKESTVSKIWNLIKEIYQKHGQKTYHESPINCHLSERSYLILCGASDVLFPHTDGVNTKLYLVNEESFWYVVQSGLFHQNSLSRKQSLYLLKRIVDILSKANLSVTTEAKDVPLFYWNYEKSEMMKCVWTDFILLMETLEEKQVHMIKPLMPKLDKIISATAKVTTHELPLLHTSWVTTIVQRIACHHTMYIQRWGVTKFLSLDFTKFPLCKQEGKVFLTGPFIAMLTETAIYHKPIDVVLGDVPPIAEELASFFKMCFCALDLNNKRDLLKNMVLGIKGHFWSGASLVYVIRGMTYIEAAPIIDLEILHLVREIFVPVTSTSDRQFRGAVFQYLTTTVLQLMDKDSVMPLDIAAFFGLLSASECFQRGNALWVTVIQFLKDLVNHCKDGNWCKEKLVSSFATAVEEYMKYQQNDSATDLTGMVRLILLAVDCDLISLSDTATQSLTSILSPVLEIVGKMGTYVYLDKNKADHALRFLNCLLTEVQPFKGKEETPVIDYLQKLCNDFVLTSLLQYFSRCLSEISTVNDLRSVIMYMELLTSYNLLSKTTLVQNSELHNLVNFCMTLLTSVHQISLSDQLSRCCSILTLAEVCKILDNNVYNSILKFFSSWPVVSDFKKPNLEIDQRDKDQSHMNWGHISSLFLESQWTCIYIVLKKNSGKLNCLDPNNALAALDVLGGDALQPVFKCIHVVLPQLQDTLISQLVHLGWRCVQDSKRTNFYWTLYLPYMDMVFQACNLQQTQDSEVFEKLQWLCEDIFTLGEEKQGMVYVLVTKLCDWWKLSSGNMQYAVNYKDVIIKGLMFGEIHSKGKRFENEVKQYIINCGNSMAVNQHIDCVVKEDCMVRVCILTFLSQLQYTIPAHAQLAITLCETLIDLQKETLKVTSYRNFGNSLNHRRKHRLFCSLMVLHKFLEKDLVSRWYDVLLDMLVQENQPSLRCLVEWMYIRLICSNDQYLMELWKQFRNANEKKPVVMCSLLSVITHLAKLKQGKSQQDFILDALPRVLPWATAAQFNIRIFAQGCLIIMWNISLDKQYEVVLGTHSVVQSFVTFCKQNVQAEKAVQKLLKNFFYQLHPFEDFCIESLVKIIPYLTGLTDEEWIPPSRFEKLTSSWLVDGEHSLPLWSKRDILKQCTPGTWRVKYSGKDEEWMEETTDVQKKIIPWRNMLPEQNLDQEVLEEYSRKQQSAGSMILCASLIDKIPNLGGLCRTGEIFGVSEYVVGSMKYIEDKNFESLSVTAHKWLPIKEVKPQYLKQYLVEMKAEGYTLVGAEQTANSVSLTNFTFPKKTLLLLGNEKQGIPVELIQLLDVCVEIPQQGLVRSLNVHVSGALLVWEYTRQHLLTTEASS